MNELLYTTDFQVTLLLCLLKDKQFWVKVNGSLRPSDFGPQCLSFVFEIARNHFHKYGALPEPETLLLLVDSALKLTDPELESFCPPDEADLLVYALQRYSAYTATDPETAFYQAHLFDYLAFMRWNSVVQDGKGANDLIRQASDIKDELGKVHTGRFKMTNATSVIPKEERSSGTRYGFGIQAVDSKIAGGLMRKQMGLVVAGTGVGKSNLKINMMANATWKKVGTLYITLELTASRINERYQAMLAGIPASLFKLPESMWPLCYRKRYAVITNPRFKLRPYATTADMADGDYTVNDIESAIQVWKDNAYNDGLDPDQDCVTVLVDWLDRISPEGLGKVNRNSSEERVYHHIMEKMYQLTNKHNINMWTSTQAKPEAKGKEFLRFTDIAWGASKLHLVDAGIGLCPKNADEKLLDKVTEMTGENEDTLKAPECSRILNASFMKSRDTSVTDTYVAVYQGPTLKFWDNQGDAMRMADAIKANPYVGLEDLME